MKDTSTVQVLLVLPTPSTNVCSNIFLVSPGRVHAILNYFTARAESFRSGCLAAPGLMAGITTAVFLLPSAQLCQNRTIGLATNTDEYVPIRIPTTSAKENPCSTGPPNRKRAITVRKVSPEVMMVRLRV